MDSKEFLISNIIFLLNKHLEIHDYLNDVTEGNENYLKILEAYKKLLYEYNNSDLLRYRDYLEKSLNDILNYREQWQKNIRKQFPDIFSDPITKMYVHKR